MAEKIPGLNKAALVGFETIIFLLLILTMHMIFRCPAPDQEQERPQPAG
jgi:hypothetical protein